MQNDTCYILALIKRDDGERLLLGSGFYEFTSGQKHFAPNTFVNDVVELQGTDGQLLAGQVRRSTTQIFEGYIGDGTTEKQTVEQKRREFFLFFRKQHRYTAVYIMPNGTAIKRDGGYITEAPAVQELYQVQPKWRVGLAFENVNYYSYAEDSQGQEIYSFSADLSLSNIQGGGLKWDANGAMSDGTVTYGKNLARIAAVTGTISGTLVAEYLEETNEIWVHGTPSTSGYQQVAAIAFAPALVGGESYQYKPFRTSGTSSRATRVKVKWPGSTSTTNITATLNIVSSNSTLSAGANGATEGIFEISFYSNTPEDFKVKLMFATAADGATTYDDPGKTVTGGGYIWEASSGGGPSYITVDGIDDAQPVWHVIGPATNPTLTNSSNGLSITFNSTVPSGQELIVDMGKQTATMEGANVFEYISGSWLTLAPGVNRIAYTAANTTNGSKIYWNEIVG